MRKYGVPERPVVEQEVIHCECGKIAVYRERKMCKNCYSSWWYNNRTGTSAGKWINQEVGYAGAHYRVRSVRGHAHNYACVECGKRAEHWALSADATDVRYGQAPGREKDSAYSLNVYAYLPMCGGCHAAYDAKHANRNYKLKASRWDEAE